MHTSCERHAIGMVASKMMEWQHAHQKMDNECDFKSLQCDVSLSLFEIRTDVINHKIGWLWLRLGERIDVAAAVTAVIPETTSHGYRIYDR